MIEKERKKYANLIEMFYKYRRIMGELMLMI